MVVSRNVVAFYEISAVNLIVGLELLVSLMVGQVNFKCFILHFNRLHFEDLSVRHLSKACL